MPCLLVKTPLLNCLLSLIGKYLVLVNRKELPILKFVFTIGFYLEKEIQTNAPRYALAGTGDYS